MKTIIKKRNSPINKEQKNKIYFLLGNSFSKKNNFLKSLYIDETYLNKNTIQYYAIDGGKITEKSKLIYYIYGAIVVDEINLNRMNNEDLYKVYKLAKEGEYDLAILAKKIEDIESKIPRGISFSPQIIEV